MQALAFAKPVEWLFLAVSLFLTWRYGWILDDAFVYFRYVDNWLFLGRGLVFNPGEFVEGYTSPLWILWLGGARLSELDYWSLVRVFSVVFAASFWAMCVVLRRRLTRPGPTLNLPLAVFATHYGVQSYFSSGLETPLVQCMALVYALFALTPKSRTLGVIAGLAPLVRPDLVLPWLVYVAGLGFATRRVPLWLVGSALVSNGAWLVFRVVYYADLLPNTYYLKDATDWSQGLAYLENSFESQGLGLVFLAMIVVSALLLWRRKKLGEPLAEFEGRARILMLAAALTSIGYVWRAGGDMLYFRFLAFPVVLGLSAFHGVAERFADQVRLPRRAWSYPLLAASTGFLLLLGYPRQLFAHPVTVKAVHEKTMHKVDGISDASWHRYHPEFHMDPARREQNRQLLERYAAYQGAPGREPIIAEGLCVRAYFAFDKNVVHSWGLTEPVLARTNVEADRPGHKYGLLRLARDLARARRVGGPRQAGLVRRALARGARAPWLSDNLDAIEVIEAKMYNRHAPLENLRLALDGNPRVAIEASALTTAR